MSRSRSPSYPSQPIQKCIELISNVFQEDRTNPIDRETAAKHIGYSGLSGAADKTLSTLAQYGFLEKAGTGEVQVTALAVAILHPNDSSERLKSLREAATQPVVFKQILDRFSDGLPSRAALESWLVREGFSNPAISPIVRSFSETMRFIQSEGVELSSDSEAIDPDIEGDMSDNDDGSSHEAKVVQDGSLGTLAPAQTPTHIQAQSSNEWFRIKLSKGKGISIQVFGDDEVTAKDIEKLIIMLEAQKIALSD